MTRLPTPEEWDHESDVLIIGAGTAGLPAAISAIEAGSTATVLETTSITGGSGNLITAGGAFAGTDLQKEIGIEDSPEQLYRDGVEVAAGVPELWRAFADNQLDTYAWLKSIGAGPSQPFCLQAPGHRAVRIHFYDGPGTMATITKKAQEMGADIQFGVRASRLIFDPDSGRVLGARVSVKGKPKNYKAKKAVIIATGGFGRNKEMLNEYGRRFIDCVPLMPAGHMGDGLKMSLDLGSATKDIGHAVVASLQVCTKTNSERPVYVVVSGGVAVNVNGERFYDESCPKGYYGDLSDAGMDQPDGHFWIVYDQAIRNSPAVSGCGIEKAHEFKADTLEELAKVSGVDPQNFVETMDRYNEDLESEGYDTIFGRKTMISNVGEPPMIQTPPYYAIKCRASISSFKGGVKVNSRFQPVNNYGEAIPGLYAVGEVAGGLWGKGTYLGGVMWASSMTFGRLAGRSASFDLEWDR